MTPSTQPIRFFHRGRIVDVSGVHPTRSVLDWLREDARCTGTKEGCNEGDCGACTVVVGELAEPGEQGAVGGLRLRRSMPASSSCRRCTARRCSRSRTCNAAAAPHESTARLHPVQQAMVDCHGSQCGFCTPGFVMSLWSTYEHHRRPARSRRRQQLADDLSGNLCRCTGYRPILDAGQRMFDLPARAARHRAGGRRARQPAARRRASTTPRPGPAAGPLPCADHAGRTGRAARAPSRTPSCWPADRRRPVGQQAVPRPRRHHLRRRRRRAEGASRTRRPTAELDIGAGASLEDAFGALVRACAEPDRRLAALRLAADPPCGHAWAATSPTARRSAIRRRC